MLLTKDIEALVIHDLKGKTVIRENEDYVWVETKQVKTGTNLYFGLSTKFGGLHVIIPGNVGTTPVKISGHGTRSRIRLFPVKR
jgi:UDP-N-acetylmuramate dehydrogenase